MSVANVSQPQAVQEPAADLPLPSRLLGWGIVALALVLRLLWLGIKPPHFDEGVNGWFVDQMTRQGYFSYDPTNYHGPFHFYVLFVMQTLFGRSIEVMRMPLVLINTANVWLLLQFRRFIPWRACLFAALAFAVSPGMLFYSRYAIHEAWLVFGMTLGLWGAAELWARGTARGLWAAGAGALLMLLNKETHIIHFAAFALALATLAVLELILPSAKDGVPTRPAARQWSWAILGDIAAGSLFLLAFFYSGGFLEPAPEGVSAAQFHGEQFARFFSAFTAWSHTGLHGTDHAKPWYYWLQLFVRYEVPALIGLFWSLRALWPGMNRLARFVAIYGCGTLVGYSIVPYKTPWCVISLLWPFLILFGCAADSAMRSVEKEWKSWILGAVAVVLCAASLAVAANLNYRYPTIPGETALPSWAASRLPFQVQEVCELPTYVYVQTTTDYFQLTRPLKALLAMDPRARHMPVNILLSSYHPLPWELGDMTRVGYYEKGVPAAPDAGVIVAENDRTADLESQLKQTYFVVPFHLRDAMEGGKLYLNAARFASVFPGRAPDFTPAAAPQPTPEP
ncbi:MAG: TIGR03663 family protein [Chthoniobacteraceae bacterium]|nr:TIGR03663 family protein [Chthoniobacteraceae bacterium]